MQIAKIKYLGNLRTQVTHIKSSNQIITDAPLDNSGKGEAFSPTDMLCAAYASCMITIMGINAAKNNFKLGDVESEIFKTMGIHPRRVIEISLNFNFSENDYTSGQKEILKRAALTCPVAESLHPDLKQSITFNF